MRILVTNDDGIDAPGLKIVEAIAAQVAGPDGEVWVVAPEFERSGVGHCISYINPALFQQRSERRYALEGYPADCVLAGIYEVFGGEKPDLILSGVNRGNNSAENTLYSGTIGAAMEGALQGAKAIALSQYYGPGNANLDNPFEAALETGAEVVRKILDADQWGNGDRYSIFYNVNFPPVAAKDIKGLRAVAQGRRENTNFSAQPPLSPSGRKFMWISGAAQQAHAGDDTDATVNMAGFTSITPMRADLTDYDTTTALKALVE